MMLYWNVIVWLWRPFEYSQLVVIFKKLVWEDLSFMSCWKRPSEDGYYVLYVAKWIHAFMFQILIPPSKRCSRNWDSSYRQHFSNLLLQKIKASVNSKCEQFPVCRWQEWWLVWSSAAVLLQCVVLLEMLLCIPWFRWTATWVSFSFLSVQISLATLLWPTEPTEFLHTEYFLFFWPVSLNPRDCC